MSSQYLNWSKAMVLLCLLLSGAVACRAQIAASQVDITFQIKNAGLTVNGNFRQAGAQLIWTEVGIPKSIEAWAEAASIDTGIGSRDKHLQKEEYFHTEKFPRLLISLKALENHVGERLEGVFVLYIKGISREMKIPFRQEQSSKEQRILSAAFTVNRIDFGIGKKSWIMADEVQVKVKIYVPTI